MECGLDEAGRGCLAGPVVAAAVILPKDHGISVLNDSKQLSPLDRISIAKQIKKQAVSWSISWCDAAEIDKVNILNASILAMHKSVEGLKIKPQHLLVDGNRFKPYLSIPHTCIVKGDATYQSIAAASILAKTFRDQLMEELSSKFPEYGWDKNMGYPTIAHRKAIFKYGFSTFHRKSFKVRLGDKVYK